jgi:hypothetical protein
MNEAQARALLTQRLTFGDARQLQARDYLRAVAELRLRVMHCKRCHGEGVMRNGAICPRCAAHFPADVCAALGIAAGPRAVVKPVNPDANHEPMLWEGVKNAEA